MTETEMLATVDWSGDGDDTDFFLAIERIFDLRLRSYLPWTTFGEVRDHVIEHVLEQGGTGSACATQMAFYRIRSALGLNRKTRPDEPLAAHLRGHLRPLMHDLEADTQLIMPTTRIGPLGLVSICFLLLAAGILLFSSMGPAARSMLALLCGAIALHSWFWDQRRLPPGVRTLGDFAQRVADRNRGRLARKGASLSNDEIWQIIRTLAADEGGYDPNQIGAETTFFRSKVRAA